MAYNSVVFAGSIAEVDIGVAEAIALLLPLLAQIDITLFGEFGLGALSFDLNLQLQAALSLSASISLNISNPFIGFSIALSAIVMLEAQIQLALSGAVPVFSIDASFQLAFLANLTASIGLQLGGLEALLQAFIALKIPALTFASLDLTPGPLYVLSFDSLSTPITLSQAGSSLAGDFNTGLSYGSVTPISPGDDVFGLVLVTKNPAVWNALALLLLTS